MPRSPVYSALAAAVLFLALVPLGTSVFVLGFVHGDAPCILCWAQRIGMTVIALIGLFILRYGPKPRYVGLGVLVAAYGVFMAIRHSSLHLARDIGQGFAIEMLGAHTYTWSFAVFWVCLVVMAAMLLAVPVEDLQPGPPRTLGAIDRAALGSFLVVVAGTIVQAFAGTGPPPYVGQADPVRFSFDPRHWVWSLDEYSAAPVSLRGRWAVERPDVTRADEDPARSPLGSLPHLAVVERRPLGVPLNGTPTGLEYDRAGDRFMLTTEHGIYLLDRDLRNVLRSTVVDPLFSVDLKRFVAAVPGEDGLVAVTENKSFVVVRESTRPDARRNRRYFLESPGAFDEVTRSRFATVRARLMYVMAAAADPGTRSIVTISVPNARSRQWIVSRFDAADMQLVEEFVPRLDPSLAAPAPADSNPLAPFYVTGATVADGRLYALSAAGSTLLTIDLQSRTVVAAAIVPGLSQPTGLALRDGRFHVIGRDGTLSVVERP
jgi:disulfide bond formation protein DsbB